MPSASAVPSGPAVPPASGGWHEGDPVGWRRFADLGPLDLAETSAQLAAVLGAVPDPALVRRIHRRSDGNPFFIEQLAWAHADGESSSVPASLRDILLTQLSRQAREVQDLLARGRQAIARGELFEHPRPEAFLELSDASQHGRVVNRETFGGGAHRPSARGSKEIPHVIPVDHGAFPRRALRFQSPVLNCEAACREWSAI